MCIRDSAYTDLLVIDLKNIKEPRLIERKENLFESFYFIEGSNRLLSHYETTDITEKFDCSHSQYGNNIIIDRGGVFVDLSGNPGVNNFESSADGNPKTGQGGSMARFTISKNPVSYTHLRAHETVLDLVCRLLLEKKKKTTQNNTIKHEIRLYTQPRDIRPSHVDTM